jgi:hypothetical protein
MRSSGDLNMKLTFRYQYILCALLIVFSNAIGGSVFSSYGIGLPYSFPNARSMGMGGTAIAIPYQYAISRTNPARLSGINKTSLSLQYLYEQNKYKDDTGRATSQYANFDGFTFVVPFGEKLGIAASMHPFTRIDYNIRYQQSQTGQLYTKSVEGIGGLNTFSFSLYWDIASQIAIGVSGDYIFGKIKENWEVTYESADFISTSDLLSTKNWGYGLTAGILIHPVSTLHFGAVYQPKIDLDTRTSTYYAYTVDALTQNGTIKIPASWGIGISYGIGQFGLIGADFHQQNWSQLEINNQILNRTQNIQRFSLGGELHFSDDPFEAYYKRMSYRVGICLQPFFVDDVAGRSITEKWFSFGLGLPLLMNMAQVDLALAFGQRGSLENNGISENLFRISLSISGGEKWFVRRY